MENTRKFSSKQRQTLFILADGQCQQCGKSLKDDWEADHVTPWSKGGKTTLVNGQALCRKCNREKGNEMLSYRKWQERFFEDYLNKNSQDYLLVATPGGGKTIAALGIAKKHADTIPQIIVVCPTEPLKRQWAKEAAAFGIQLDPNWNGTKIKDGFNGIVLTYSSVIGNYSILDWHCNHLDTFVIFDEIHHAGDQKTWGQSIKSAFGLAKKRLCLSGTPFRSDNDEIPFVTYKDGQSVSDFKYSYGDAIVDGVCRNIIFPSFDGDVSWWDSKRGELVESLSFDEIMTEQEESQRRRAALHPSQPFVKSMLIEANKKLDEIRQDDKRAGGLVITMDTDHADAIAEILTKISGEAPTVVHSNILESADLITDFGRSSKKWIVSVKMVSEGIDIKRLRVGVYATNAITELLFRQIVGRVIRRVNKYDPDDSWAFFYVPKDRPLVEYMEKIKEERQHFIDRAYQEEARRSIEPTSNGETQRAEIFVVSAEHNPNGDVVVTEGNVHQAAFAQEALEVCRRLGISANEAQAANLVKELEAKITGNKIQIEAPAKDIRPDYLRVRDLRRVVNSKAFSIAHQMTERYQTRKSAKDIVRIIHAEWSRLPGKNRQAEAGLEELEAKLEWLDSQLENPWKYI